MIPLVVAVLVVALGYFLYTKYITPPFVEDAGDVSSEAVLPAASSSASSTQTLDFANLAKSPMIVDPKRSIAAQQVPSATNTALSSPSTTTAMDSPSMINARLPPSAAAENVLPSSAAVLQGNLDQTTDAVKKLAEDLKSTTFAADVRKMLDAATAPSESKSAAEKTPAIGMPSSGSPGIASPDMIVPAASAPTHVAPLVIDADGTSSPAGHSPTLVPAKAPSSNASDTPRKHEKKSKTAKKKKTKSDRKSTDKEKKKEKKHGSKSKTKSGGEEDGKKKKKHSKKHKSKRDDVSAPNKGSEQSSTKKP